MATDWGLRALIFGLEDLEDDEKEQCFSVLDGHGFSAPKKRRAFLGLGDADLQAAGILQMSTRVVLRRAMASVAGPGAGSAAGAGAAAAGGPGADVLTAVGISKAPSALGADSKWHKFAFAPTAAERDAAVPSSSKAAFFGFRPCAIPPAVIPPQLVSPVFSPILDAASAPAEPPASWGTAEVDLHGAVRRLLKLGSNLYSSEEQLHHSFLTWHSSDLLAGQLTRSSSTSTLSAAPDGILTSRSGGPTGKTFAVAILECKSDVGSGDPLVQALRYYQKYYGDGSRWASNASDRCDPMPVLLLLLEGPRLSIHAAWTIYQNRVGYAPLTPSYYLANEEAGAASDSSNVWRLMAVLSAYKKTVAALDYGYASRQRQGEAAMQRAASLRTAAHTAGVGVAAAGAGYCVRPCTLPYSLLDESLGLSAIAFRGPGLLYEARMRARRRVELGGSGKEQEEQEEQWELEERAVLVKFVRGRYGAKVHQAWHGAGLAPELYDLRPLAGGGGSGGLAPYLMVVMELLRPEDGWVPLRHALAGAGAGGGGTEPIKDAVRQALRAAHAVPVARSAAAGLVLADGGSGGSDGGGGAPKAVHGDMRLPNIMVRSTAATTAGATADVGGAMGSSPATTWHVRFVDFDWAGLEGDASARYPLLLSPQIRWPEGVAPGAEMRQQHDANLLEMEMALA